jgi:hypothetical protein
MDYIGLNIHQGIVKYRRGLLKGYAVDFQIALRFHFMPLKFVSVHGATPTS